MRRSMQATCRMLGWWRVSVTTAPPQVGFGEECRVPARARPSFCLSLRVRVAEKPVAGTEGAARGLR